MVWGLWGLALKVLRVQRVLGRLLFRFVGFRILGLFCVGFKDFRVWDSRISGLGFADIIPIMENQMAVSGFGSFHK